MDAGPESVARARLGIVLSMAVGTVAARQLIVQAVIVCDVEVGTRAGGKDEWDHVSGGGGGGGGGGSTPRGWVANSQAPPDAVRAAKLAAQWRAHRGELSLSMMVYQPATRTRDGTHARA